MTVSEPKHNGSFYADICEFLNLFEIRNIAWRGSSGSKYFQENKNYSKSLQSLSSLAKTDTDLCRLAAGWKQVRSSLTAMPAFGKEFDCSLFLIFEDFSPELLTVLKDLHKGGTSAAAILLDPECRFCRIIESENFPRPDSSKFISRASEDEEAVSYPGILAQAYGIYYPNPVCIKDLEKACSIFKKILKRSGISIFHIIGRHKEHKADISKKNNSLFLEDLPERRKEQIRSKNMTFEQAALKRLAKDLRRMDFTSCLWASRLAPEYFKIIKNRLQKTSVSGVMMQAAGIAASGVHPLAVISAADLPAVLSGIFETANFPITILETEAGLKSYEGRIPNINRCDLSILKSVKNLTIGVPADEEEARSMLQELMMLQGPGILRLSSSPAIGISESKNFPSPSGLRGVCLKHGKDLSFVCLGSSVYYAILAIQTLKSWGIDAGIYNMRWLSPLDTELLQQAAESTRIIAVEEHAKSGALCSAVSEYLTDRKLNNKVRLKTIGFKEDEQSSDLEDHGISLEGLLEAAKQLL